jgi:hypothetical protein
MRAMHAKRGPCIYLRRHVYDIHMHLNFFNIITNDGSKYIVTNFNINTQKIIILYVCIKLIHVQTLHS